MAHSSHMLNKEDLECDYTKFIPAEILHHILSYLPIQSFANTQFVCKRWHSFSNTISRSSGSIKTLESAINNFIYGINTSDPFRHPWRLSYIYNKNGSALRATVTSTLDLHMNFFKPEKTTGLFHLSLETAARNGSESEDEVTSFYVKSLHLTSVSSDLTGNAVSSVFSSFVFLQRLHIEGCKMNTLFVSAPELRELTILDCLLLKTVHVNAPKLDVFRFRGTRPWFLAKGLDRIKLVDTMLDFRKGINSRYFGSKLNSLLLLLKYVECLTLCRATFELHDPCILQEMITSEQYTQCEKFKLEKLKELWWIDNSVDKQKINVLLSFLKICPVLEKLFITIDPNCSWTRRTVKRFEQPVNNAQLPNLEFIKMEGCIDEDAEVLLVEAIVDSATMAPLIVSTTIDGAYRSYVAGSECAQAKRTFEHKKALEIKIHPHMII